MATERINVVLSANDTATPQLKQFNTELKNTQKTSKEMQSGTGSLGSMGELGGQIQALGLAFAGNQAIQMIGDLNRLGIEAQGTTSVFQAMAAEVGGADDLLESLRTTTGNVVDDMTLMGGASSILRMGLADSSDGVNELVEMAVKLKKPYESATEAIDNFTLMLSNQSVARLDSFGISSGKVRTRIDELLASGQALNREEAFTMAVMEEGSIAMERLGDAANISESAVNRLSTRIENLKNKLAEGTAGVIEHIASVIAYEKQLNEVLNNAANFAEEHGIDPDELAYQETAITILGQRIVLGSSGQQTYSSEGMDANRVSQDQIAAWETMQATAAQARVDQISMPLQTELNNTTGFAQSKTNAMGFMNDTDKQLLESSIDWMEGELEKISENPLISSEQLENLESAVEDAKGLAEEAERAQQAFDNMSLSDLFGQSDGGRLGDLGDMITSNIEDDDQRAAVEDALNMASGRETELSQAFEDQFAPILADVFDQFGEDIGIQATEAALAALETAQMGGLTAEDALANIGTDIGFRYAPGQDGGQLYGQGPATNEGEGEVSDSGELISESMENATVSAMGLETVVKQIDDVTSVIAVDTLEASVLSTVDGAIMLTEQLEIAAKPANKTLMVRVKFQYDDPAGKKLLEDDLSTVVDNNGGVLPDGK